MRWGCRNQTKIADFGARWSPQFSYMTRVISNSLAGDVNGINRALSVAAKGLLCKLRTVIAHVSRPLRDQFREAGRVIGEQRADRFFVMRPITGHRRHEAVG